MIFSDIDRLVRAAFAIQQANGTSGDRIRLNFDQCLVFVGMRIEQMSLLYPYTAEAAAAFEKAAQQNRLDKGLDVGDGCGRADFFQDNKHGGKPTKDP